MADFLGFDRWRRRAPAKQCHSARARRRQRFPTLPQLLARDSRLERLEDRYLLSGDFGFATTLDGSQGNLSGSVVADSAGETYVTTSLSVSKYSASGSLEWSHPLSTPNSAAKLSVDSSGNAYLTGYQFGGGFHDDMFVTKLDSNGNLLWSESTVGSLHEYGTAIGSDAAGNVYVTGYFEGTADFDPGQGTFDLTSQTGYSGFICKYDKNGGFVWAEALPGSGALGLAIDDAGNAYVTGHFSGTTDFDPGPGVFNLTPSPLSSLSDYVLKLNSSGAFVWAQQFDNVYSSEASIAGVAVDGNGNVLTAGTYRGTMSFGSGPQSQSLSIDPAGGTAEFVAKLDGAGNIVWARSVGDSPNLVNDIGNVRASAIAVDDSGSVYTTGAFSGRCDFDPGSGTHFLSNTVAASTDVFISKLDQNGRFAWAKSVSGISYDVGTGIAADDLGHVYVTGAFAGAVDFDPGPGVHVITSPIVSESFLLQLTQESISGQAWSDTNGNGLRDPSDAGVPGVVALLFSSVDAVAGNADDKLVARQVTDADGDYNFTGLSATLNYYVEFRLPGGFNFTTPGTRDGRADSDVDPGAGRTGVFTLAAAQDDSVADAGLIGAAPGFGFAFGLGSVSQNSQGLATATDASGNVYVVGRFQGAVDFDPGPGVFVLMSGGGYDAFVAKYTAAGALLWARDVGGSSDDEADAIAADSQGNVYAAGSLNGAVNFDPSVSDFTLISSGGANAFISKFDANGNFVWAANLGAGAASKARGVALANDGSIWTTGTFSGTGDFDPGAGTTSLSGTANVENGFISQLDANGNYLQAELLAGNSDVAPAAIAAAVDGSILLGGSFAGAADFDPGAGVSQLTSAGSTDGFVLKLDASGRFVWADALGGPGNDHVAGIAVAAEGDVYTTGDFSGTVDFGHGSNSFELTASGGADAFVWRLDGSGSLTWADNLGAGGQTQGTAIALAPNGDVYSTGTFQGTGDFNPGSGIYQLTSAGQKDVYVSKLNAQGQFAGAAAAGGAGDDLGASIAVDANANVLATGSFQRTTNFSPDSSAFSLTSTGATDAFLLAWNQPDPTPNFRKGPDQVVDEDCGPQSVSGWASDITPSPDSSGQIVNFAVTTDNDSLFATLPAIDPSSGALTYTPAENSSGSATVTVRLQVGPAGDTWETQTFKIRVNYVNDAPSFTASDPPAVNEDSGYHTISNWAVSSPGPGANESGQLVYFQVANVSNPALFQVLPYVNSAGTLQYTLAQNVSGSSTFDVQAQDTGGTLRGGINTSAVQTFSITVNFVNDAPAFSAADPPAVNEDSGAHTIPNWAAANPGSGANEAEQSILYLTANISNPALFAVPPSVAPDGTLKYTLADNASGSSTFDVQVQDNGGTAYGGVDTSASQRFTLTANFVNDAPTLAASEPPAADEDSGAHVIANWAAITPGPGVNEASQSVSVITSNVSNPALFAVSPSVMPDGTLTYTLADNVWGSSTFGVRVQDNGGTANGGVDSSPTQTFTITVYSVNRAPSFTKGPDQSVDEDAGLQAITNWATNISPGPGANETNQRLNFVVTNDNPTLFAVQPSIDAFGKLTYQIAAEQTGTAQVSVRLHDDGGTVHGGVDTSASQTFTISAMGVAPVAFPDSFVLSASASSGGHGSTSVLANDRSDDRGLDNMTAVLVTPPAHGTLVLHDDGSFTYSPDADFHGLDRFMYRAVEEGLTSAPTMVSLLSYPASIVDKLYHQALGRAPDDAGLESWTTRIEDGATYGQIAQGIFESDERLDPIIENYYKQFLLRDADAAGLAYWRDRVWKAEGGPEQVVAGMISSAEFFFQAGGAVQSWLNQAYRRLLGREADEAGLQYWAQWINSGRMTLAQVVLDGFESSSEYYGNLVDEFFHEYLNHNPNDAELHEYVVQLQSGASQRDIQFDLIDLPEYRNTPPIPADGEVARSLYLD